MSAVFDNVIVRLRGEQCIVSSVAPPFVTAYWPEVDRLLSELGLGQVAAASLGELDNQRRFLTALADKVPEAAAFRPEKIGFRSRGMDIRLRERFRAGQAFVTFLGQCSREVILGTVDILMQRASGDWKLDAQFKRWDLLKTWGSGQECLSDLLNFFYVTKQRDVSIIFYCSFEEIPEGLWEYIYERRGVRLGWLAVDLAGCSDMAQFEAYRRENLPLKNLENLANAGIWPHIVIPATAANTSILPELVAAVAEVTRGGTVETVPIPLVSTNIEGAPPSIEEYVAALLAIYRDNRLPLRAIAPQSWVAARLESTGPLISSPEAAGASVAVLANGDVYAGEASVGLDAWRLGNILEDGEDLRWERLDAMPEVFSTSTKPEQCQACDWRHRCGGIDCSVLLAKRRSQLGSPADGWQTAFQLYCAPRKALFEEAIWDFAAAAQHAVKPPREMIECGETEITFQLAPALTPNPSP